MRQTLYSVFACLTLLTVPCAAQYTISTVAGGVSGNGLNATSQATGSPEMALDPSGNLYFVLFYESRVYKLNANGTLTLLNAPLRIAFHDPGNLYIAATGNERVRKALGGTITTVARQVWYCIRDPISGQGGPD